MKVDILQAIKAPFKVKTKPGKGNYKYIDSKDVIKRMNDVFNGSWSTHVISEEVVEDQILIRVKVQCYDTEIEQWVEHDGYGSSPIARFTFGNSEGKIVDIGNSYKGALSKAIRSACTRLGAGLDLEVSADSKVSMGATTPPVMIDSNQASELPAFPTDTPSSIPAESGVVVEGLIGGLIPPTTTTAPYEAETAVSVVETLSVPPSEIPSAPLETIPQPPATDVDLMSDVQFAALDGVLGIKGLKYEELAKEAFTADGRWGSDTVPTEPRELKYEQAVVVIKYGNDKNRQLA